MNHSPRILVVDDHRDIRDPLATFLARNGLDVATAADAMRARGILREERIDLVVLDIMLPGEDGLSLCRHLAAASGPPVILLTAMAAPVERVTGLESGAQDYVIKPFDPRELIARIRLVLRRLGGIGTGGVSAPRYVFGGWTLDLEKRELQDSAGKPVPLSSGEFRLLRALVERPGTVLSRDQLLDLTRGSDAQGFDRSIDSQISRLRKKLEPNPRRPSLLKTSWGDGYIFTANVQVQGA